MPLISGSKLGPYEIVAPIGAGGMGEVYRARDAALSRDVAIKILPPAFSEDADRLRRFKQEAQAAAALNHPNILTIYQIAESDGSPYIVSELLEGETLRQRLQAGQPQLRKAIDWAVQVARGLAAAHDKGIVHRDLKPENIFLCRDGHVKILDFGLAKLTASQGRESSSDALTLTARSEPGFVLGTAGYMSPEQARGQILGPQSDLFSLGAILYEMLAGKRAFRGETAADTMSAILKEDPPDLSGVNRQTPPALERIVRHCLEKSPEERFQSARDVAFDLEALSLASGTAPAAKPSAQVLRGTFLPRAAVAITIFAAFAAGALVTVRRGSPTMATYHRITFRAGTVQEARFAPDGQNILYSASLEGKPPEIFATRPQSPQSRALGLTGSALLAVSPTGEMAVSLGAHVTGAIFIAGTLARVPLEGGAPREMLPNVEGADWARDGTTWVTARQAGDYDFLELSSGTLLYKNGGAISHPRFSPGGDRIAFFDHPTRASDAGSVVVTDLRGKATTLSSGWTDLSGLAWSPRGDEVWFSGDRNNSAVKLFAVTLSGREREIATSPGDLHLYDISRDGRVLLGSEDWRSRIYGLSPGETMERDLSWLDYSVASDLSSDGQLLVFYEAGEGGGTQFSGFLRRTDGSPAVQLFDGVCGGLRPDGQEVICMDAEGQLLEVPTKAGAIKPLPHDQIFHAGAFWFPDGKRIFSFGREQDHGQRIYVRDLAGGQPRPITPEGASFFLRLSPDATRLAVAMGADYRTMIYPVSGGEPRPVPGLKPGDVPRSEERRVGKECR